VTGDIWSTDQYKIEIIMEAERKKKKKSSCFSKGMG
jgi:hypothetical protein